MKLSKSQKELLIKIRNADSPVKYWNRHNNYTIKGTSYGIHNGTMKSLIAKSIIQFDNGFLDKEYILTELGKTIKL